MGVGGHFVRVPQTVNQVCIALLQEIRGVMWVPVEGVVFGTVATLMKVVSQPTIVTSRGEYVAIGPRACLVIGIREVNNA